MSSSPAIGSIERARLRPQGSLAAGSAVLRRWSRQVAADLVGLFDALSVLAGAAVSAVIYQRIGGVVAEPMLLVQSSLAGAIIVCMCLRMWGLYDTSRMHEFPLCPARLLAALLLGIGGVLGLGLPRAIAETHVAIWFFTWLAASYTLLVLCRGVARRTLARLTAQGRFHERIAVFGAGEIARRVQEFLSDPRLAIELAGVYDDRMSDGRIDRDALFLSGRLDELIEHARHDDIDRIVVALPQSAGDRVASVARRLEQLPASIHIVTHIASDLVDVDRPHKVSSLGTVGLLDVKKKPLADWAHVVKVLEDLILGSLFFVISLPFLPLIAAAIKLDSPGPVFFRQRRRGLNKRVIEVIKLRTMTVLEDGADVRQATPGDRRVTAVGRFLRRTSLDELPQLVNVLRGEMSLVGPRPHALIHDEQFGEQLETYANRHQVKPGITGLAQVRGFRGEAGTPDRIEARVNADIEYIRTWTLGLDLKILAQTVRAIISGNNAH